MTIDLLCTQDAMKFGNEIFSYTYRVEKFACPRVHDDQKMNEDNQNLRCGCPPDYQIFGG